MSSFEHGGIEGSNHEATLRGQEAKRLERFEGTDAAPAAHALEAMTRSIEEDDRA